MDHDVIILGSGPAGLQAAIHAARRKASVLVMGKMRKSSAHGAHIENFCCISGRQGKDLLVQGRAMAESHGAVFLEEDATEIDADGGIFRLKTENGSKLTARALVLTMGVSRTKLGIPGEKELRGKGVSYCVECDASFFRGESVAVAGGESAAVTGALTLLFYAREVHLVTPALEVASVLADSLRSSGVVLHEGRKVTAVEGQERVERVVLDDGTFLPVAGLFIELGARGAIELVGGLGVELDPQTLQFVSTNRKQETNVPGIYAAGDITGPPWQMAKAVGEGCVAGLEAAAYARAHREQHGGR